VLENSCIHGIKLVSRKAQTLTLCIWGEVSMIIITVDINTGSCTTTFSKQYKDWILDCAPFADKVSEEFRTVVVGMSHGQIEIWNIYTMELVSRYKIEEEGIIYSLCFNGKPIDGQLYVAIGNLFNEIHIYSLPQYKLVSKLVGHKV
jgi:WD40 repeat protein